MPVAILKTMVFSPATEAELAAHFEVHPMPKAPAELEALLATAGKEIRGIATNSHGPVTVAMLDRLPKLEIIASQSAGAEGIAVNEARRILRRLFDEEAGAR